MSHQTRISILITVLACIAVQFFADFSILTIHCSIIAGLVIAFLPAILAPSPSNDVSVSSENSKKEKWRTIQPENIDAVFTKLNNQRVNVTELSGLGNLFAFLTSIGMLIVALVIAVFLMLDENYALASLTLDLVAVPRAFFIMIYGCTPHDTKGERVSKEIATKLPCAQQIITYTKGMQAMDANRSFSISPQLQISKTGTRPTISDIRLNLVPVKEIKDLLCAMISISQNDVQGTKYPYAYGVFVFKNNNSKKAGHKNNKSNTAGHRENHIHEILYERGNEFKLESKTQDGNQLFIILKNGGDPEYTTTFSDCHELVESLDKICALLINGA